MDAISLQTAAVPPQSTSPGTAENVSGGKFAEHLKAATEAESTSLAPVGSQALTPPAEKKGSLPGKKSIDQKTKLSSDVASTLLAALSIPSAPSIQVNVTPEVAPKTGGNSAQTKSTLDGAPPKATSTGAKKVTLGKNAQEIKIAALIQSTPAGSLPSGHEALALRREPVLVAAVALPVTHDPVPVAHEALPCTPAQTTLLPVANPQPAPVADSVQQPYRTFAPIPSKVTGTIPAPPLRVSVVPSVPVELKTNATTEDTDPDKTGSATELTAIAELPAISKQPTTGSANKHGTSVTSTIGTSIKMTVPVRSEQIPVSDASHEKDGTFIDSLKPPKPTSASTPTPPMPDSVGIKAPAAALTSLPKDAEKNLSSNFKVHEEQADSVGQNPDHSKHTDQSKGVNQGDSPAVKGVAPTPISTSATESTTHHHEANQPVVPAIAVKSAPVESVNSTADSTNAVARSAISEVNATSVGSPPIPKGQAMPAQHDSTPRNEPTGDMQSARIVDRAGQQEMHIGFRTPEFGSVEVHTAVHESQVGLVVGSEKGDLRNFLTAEFPTLQTSFRQHDLRFDNIHFLSPGSTLSGGSSSNGDAQSGAYRYPRPGNHVFTLDTTATETNTAPAPKTGGLSVHA